MAYWVRQLALGSNPQNQPKMLCMTIQSYSPTLKDSEMGRSQKIAGYTVQLLSCLKAVKCRVTEKDNECPFLASACAATGVLRCEQPHTGIKAPLYYLPQQ